MPDHRTPLQTQTVIKGPGFVIPWTQPDERQERRRWRQAGVVPEEVTA